MRRTRHVGLAFAVTAIVTTPAGALSADSATAGPSAGLPTERANTTRVLYETPTPSAETATPYVTPIAQLVIQTGMRGHDRHAAELDDYAAIAAQGNTALHQRFRDTWANLDATVRTVIYRALDNLDKPYLYATDGPVSFDCSGLTLDAYRTAGIALPRNSFAQYRASEHVEVAEVGDLVFLYRNGGIDHVGIYLGHDKYIHASGHNGQGVTISGIDLTERIVRVARPYRTAPHVAPDLLR